MKVIIAEKPSVARDIANIVGATKRNDGYLEGNGYAVTWAFGHLVTLAMPEEYGFKGFDQSNLPILPPEFKLIPRQIKDSKKWKPDPGTLKQLKVIRTLFNKCERIIVATDAGREGELIFRHIYNYLGSDKPFDRLWISSLTDKAIRSGLKNLRPGSEYDNLYLSAKARSQADWLVGINSSQALSISAGYGTWSLGRVQTPTLAMICSRYLENKDFKAETYFQIKLNAAKDSIPFAAQSTDRYKNKEEAEEIINHIHSEQFVSVASVQKKEVNQEPPLLYDLTTLQKEANSRYSFSADKTLTVAQSLYEAKLISYPRTGSRYISEDVFTEITPLITQLSTHAIFGNYAKILSGKNLNKRSVNDKKVTDHHALIITENTPAEITSEQRIIYDMIAARMLESFSGKCIKENTTVSISASGTTFMVKGSVILTAGWRAVLNAPDKEVEEEDTVELPVLIDGDVLTYNGAYLQEKQTKPHALHTESSLLSAMETCGKDLADEAEREALKESGIGTPATRAAIIETLFSRDYITREKKSLVPTGRGLTVYLAVRNKKIADVAMTGAWENALNKIVNGGMDADTFHKSIEVYTTQITHELLKMKIEGKEDKESYPCPKCRNGKVVLYKKVAKCQDENCGLTVFRNKSGKELTNAQLAELFTKGKTGVIKGFKSKENKPFDAAITFDNEYKTIFSFPKKKK